MLGSTWFDSVNMGTLIDPTSGRNVLLCAWYRKVTYVWILLVHTIVSTAAFYISVHVYGVEGGQRELAIWLAAMVRGTSTRLSAYLSGLCDYKNFGFRVRSALTPVVIGLEDTNPEGETGHLAYRLVRMVGDHEGGMMEEPRPLLTPSRVYT